jgi:hypothetical protein
MTAPLLARLDLARRELLDLGLRNALISHSPRARQVPAIDERAADIFRILVRERRAMPFDPMPDERAKEAIAAANEPGLGIEELRSDVFLAHEGPIENSSLERHTDNRLQTALSPDALQSKLLSIHNDARSHIEEKGVNILFLAVGFLHWRETATSTEARRAPLLLIPVTLERAHARARFQIRWTDADIGDNLSLAEKLRAEFSITLPSIGEADDLDVPGWLGAVAAAVAEMPGWRVEANEVTLGFFSFGKFQMYADLDPSKWAKSPCPPVLKALLEDGFRDSPSIHDDSELIDKIIDPADACQVKDADSSQLLAILDVASGRNLVLQGPPGTGKSQTITNIIAECIGTGRTVLFVAEKMAALDVVKRRLDECGLSDAVLELHSHKTNKKQVLGELERTLRQGRPVTRHAGDDIAILTQLRDRLNAYCEAVNRPVGSSRQSFVMALGKASSYAMGRHTDALLPFSPMSSWTDADYRQRRMTVQAMDRHLASAGAPADSPFPNTRLTEFLPLQRDQLLEHLRELERITEQLHAEAFGLSVSMSLPAPADVASATALSRAAHRATECPVIQGIDLESGEWRLRGDELARLLAAGRALASAHARLDREVTEEAWIQDLGGIRETWVNWGHRWWRFLRRDFREARARMRGLLRGPLPRAPSYVLEVIDTLLESQAKRQIFEQHAPLGRALFGELWEGLGSDWSKLDSLTSWVSTLHREVADGVLPPGIVQFLSSPPRLDGIAAEASSLDILRARHSTAWAAIEAELGLPATEGCARLPEATFDVQIEQLRRWIAGIGRLDERVRFNHLAAQLEKEGLGDLLAICWAWREPAGELTRLFDHSWHAGLVHAGYEDNPPIRQFNRSEHDVAREHFGRLDHLLFEYNRARLALAHWQRLPNPSAGGEVATITSAANRQRNIMPIRSLMQKAGRAVQAIKPVFMMGPMSVATYLPPGSVEFDLVVFDEASQVKPADALGAIMRGRQAVVVGDSKQLPPTGFFDTLVDGSDESTDEFVSSVGDMESILSLFLGRGAPERMLRWHYRSRHHSLIAVSNHEFYDDHLVVFPSPGETGHARGLRLRQFPNTAYDRGNTHTNLEEARIVAEAVMEHARALPDLSLGVVAFSVAQRDAIELQLERLRRADDSCEAFFKEDTAEPFFVKNLENVQGDERDVILISIGYGRDAGGYMSMNFGPLNRDGGERRLNVLISRSRLAMDVFCNFRAEDLDLSRSNARGVAALRSFLSYAQNHQLGVPEASGRDTDSPFEDAVLRSLTERGHVVEPQIGSAGFFIDIGVRDPDVPGRYVLGIECDGATYHRSRSARDRDRLRQEVLEGLGWRLHRIWSTDWFRNEKLEIERAEAAIRSAQEAARDREAAAETVPASPTRSPDDGAAHAQPVERGSTPREPHASAPYMRAHLNVDIGRVHLAEIGVSSLAKYVEAVVRTESPIHRTEVVRRITEAAGVRRTARIQQTIEAAIDHAARSLPIDRRGDFVWLTSMTTPPVRDRSGFDSNSKKIDLVAPEEIKEALVEEIRRGFSMDADDAIAAAARRLGFLRQTAQARSQIVSALSQLIESGLVNREGNRLTISKGPS